MIVLSYDSAKRSLLFMAIYLVVASLIIKGIGFVIETNLIAGFSSIGSLTNITDMNIELPQFDFSTWSFEGIKNFIREKIGEITNFLMPAFIAGVNVTVGHGNTPTILHMDNSMMVVKV